MVRTNLPLPAVVRPDFAVVRPDDAVVLSSGPPNMWVSWMWTGQLSWSHHLGGPTSKVQPHGLTMHWTAKWYGHMVEPLWLVYPGGSTT